MIVDLHAHYPMHLAQASRISPPTGHQGVGDHVRRMVLGILNRTMNFPRGGKPGVTIESLRRGGVRVALSVLYVPFDEMDLSKPYRAPPAEDYFEDLVALAEAVERDIAARPTRDAVVATDGAALRAGLDAGQVVLVHAVEGGFHLGADEEAITKNVAELGRLGAAYVTVAHLFYRQVATNAPALPFMTDGLYRTVFPQPDTGLDPRGRVLVRELCRNRILVDITHMSRRAVDETLDLLDQLDPGRTIPVIASHAACSHGTAEYNISDEHIGRVAERGGVVGLIACRHWMSDGLVPPKHVEGSLEVLHLHIDRIKRVTGTHEHTAIGTDMDGFIKPPLPGFESPAAMARVEAWLREAYGDVTADRIASGNALRVLEWWGRRPA